MKMTRALVTATVALLLLPSHLLSWNIPTHMITGAIAYQILEQDAPNKIIGARTILEAHPWYRDRWDARIQSQPDVHRDELLFMFAARWANDIRIQSETEHNSHWHYIHWPFKPHGEPPTVAVKPAHPVNILTALADNERKARTAVNADKRAIALAWLFHLLGDVHQPLNTVQLFTREYSNGDRGGNEICFRVTPERGAIDLHAVWDGLMTSAIDPRMISNTARELRGKLPREALPELSIIKPKLWARKSYELATSAAYLRGELRGTPKGRRKECREVINAELLPDGYISGAQYIAQRRTVLAGYRLAKLLTGIVK